MLEPEATIVVSGKEDPPSVDFETKINAGLVLRKGARRDLDIVA